MIQLFERLKELTSGKEKAKLVFGNVGNILTSKIKSLKPVSEEEAILADIVRRSKESSAMMKESLRTISMLEEQKKIPREEDKDTISKDDLRKELESLIEADERALELFSKIIDHDFKSDNSDLVIALKSDIEYNKIDIAVIESNSSQLMLRNTQFSLFKRRIAIEEYHKRIEERYQMTTVDPNYRYDGEQTEYSHWREEATTLFSGIDLTLFTDLQLKYYVAAMNSMPNNASIIRESMNPLRSPEHIRLLFNYLDDNAFAEVLQHPEYDRDKIVSMMPDLLEAIEENKKK